MKILNAVCFLCLLSLSAWGQSTEVPNTFQAGQPASAAEVNENFEALAEAIAAIPGPKSVFADGEKIESDSFVFLDIGLDGFSALTSSGYAFSIDADTGALPLKQVKFYYLNSSCIEPAFLSSTDAEVSNYGNVYRTGDSLLSVIDIPPNILLADRFFSSFRSANGICQSSQPGGPTQSIPVTLNDPALTGVPNEPFALPITVGF